MLALRGGSRRRRGARRGGSEGNRRSTKLEASRRQDRRARFSCSAAVPDLGHVAVFQDQVPQDLEVGPDPPPRHERLPRQLLDLLVLEARHLAQEHVERILQVADLRRRRHLDPERDGLVLFLLRLLLFLPFRLRRGVVAWGRTVGGGVRARTRDPRAAATRSKTILAAARRADAGAAPSSFSSSSGSSSSSSSLFGSRQTVSTTSSVAMG